MSRSISLPPITVGALNLDVHPEVFPDDVLHKLGAVLPFVALRFRNTDDAEVVPPRETLGFVGITGIRLWADFQKFAPFLTSVVHETAPLNFIFFWGEILR